jgi:type VI secretion system protein ImpH
MELSTPDRLEKKPLNQLLEEAPYSFEFFQAVRLLERLYSGKEPVGGTALPHEEVIRFRSRVTLDFPASEVHEIRTRTGNEEDPALEMLVNFMGMVGPSGVLPTHYSELVLDRTRYRDTAMWAFLDIFTHRSISLFYKAWAKYRFPINYERGNDELTSYMFDLVGLGTKGLRGRMGIEDESLLPYAGLVAQKPHSANAIENIIEDYFGIEASVEQFQGQWIELSKDDHTQMGLRNSSLGRSTIAGTRIWDQQSKLRIRLGPLSLQKFQGFLPNGSAHQALRSIVDFMIGQEFDYDVQLCLAQKQVPSTVLTTRAMRKPMLGWTSFLKSLPAEADDDQLVLAAAA